MNEEDLKGFIESHMKKNKMSSYDWDSYQKEEEYWKDAMESIETFDRFAETIILRIWWLKNLSTGERWKFSVWPDTYAKVLVELFRGDVCVQHKTRSGCQDFGREQWSKLVREGCVSDGTENECRKIHTSNYALDA